MAQDRASHPPPQQKESLPTAAKSITLQSYWRIRLQTVMETEVYPSTLRKITTTHITMNQYWKIRSCKLSLEQIEHLKIDKYRNRLTRLKLKITIIGKQGTASRPHRRIPSLGFRIRCFRAYKTVEEVSN